MSEMSPSLPPDYGDWLASLKQRIQGARQRALLSANAEQIQLYHDIGRDQAKLSNWERGKSLPRKPVLMRLLAKFKEVSK